MPVHIEEMNVEMQVADGDLPLTDAQIQLLVKMVINQLERKQHETGGAREATGLRTQAAPRSNISE